MTQHTRFLQLELHTHKPEPLLGFYRDVLGLPIVARDTVSFTVQTGASTIRFLLTERGEPSYHLAFNIPENKIERALEWVTPRAELIPHFRTGGLIIDWPFWNAHSVYFLDPVGNILEAIARHDLRNAADGEFGANDFLNVSEIGLVVPDPQATIELLAHTFDLPKKSVLSDFGAVGDDHGLFIVSAEDRPWMPTEHLRAQRFPARAVVQHPAPIHLEVPGTHYTIDSRVY